MKVAFIIASVSRKAGGLFESVRRLAQELQAASCAVQVLSSDDEFTAADLPEWHPLEPRTFRVLGPRQFGYSPGLGRAVRETEVDILNIHGLWMYPSVAGLSWSRRRGKPLIVHAHGMLDPWAVRHHHWKKLLAGWVYENPLLHRAACLRALCASEAEAMRQYGLTGPICVIPNGIDLPAASSPPPPPWAETLAPGRRVLLYLGRIHPKKGLPHFLHAWREARQQDPKAAAAWAVAVAGWDQNGHEAELKALAGTLGIDRDVAFVGPQFGVGKAACFSHADAFVLPSFSEGLPMAVLEAWAYGLPVVMTPQCNLPEGFAADAALRVEPEAKDTARGLRTLFDMDDRQRREMGRRGKELAAGQFSWRGVAAQMYAVNEWVLGGGAAPACVWTRA